MVDAALKRAPAELTGFTARLARPLFVGETATLAGHAARDGKMSAWIANRKGELCAQMELEFAR
jgi:3-methylfumaryl-CoA hydratase